MTTTDDPHGALLDDLVHRTGVVMLIGGPDTGKTSLARRLLRAAADAGRTAAYVDADVDQVTTGPPACVGLHWVRTPGDAEDLSRADALQFVGSTTPEGVVLQQVVATARLTNLARAEADLVVMDTTGTVSGVLGETLKYHKMELCHPETVVGLQRGAELEPLVGMLRRFFSADVEIAGVDPQVRPSSPEDRRAQRTKAFAAAFAEPLQRWRVRPTVFAPTLPAGLDLARLDHELVGIMDGEGNCLGLGALSHDDDGALRVITNAGEGMRGLRLGSLTIDLDTFEVRRVRLRDVMFGLD
ncbi:MAG: Clp1/GlmU family protein [Acidimicrobiia bacterium]|nr:Clp1/GlmU family protein [Acidimicrobiia bacterium]